MHRPSGAQAHRSHRFNLGVRYKEEGLRLAVSSEDADRKLGTDQLSINQEWPSFPGPMGLPALAIASVDTEPPHAHLVILDPRRILHAIAVRLRHRDQDGSLGASRAHGLLLGTEQFDQSLSLAARELVEGLRYAGR